MCAYRPRYIKWAVVGMQILTHWNDYISGLIVPASIPKPQAAHVLLVSWLVGVSVRCAHALRSWRWRSRLRAQHAVLTDSWWVFLGR